MLDSQTADVLRQAVGAAQSGDVARARLLAEGALESGGDTAALNAFLGMLQARAGDLGAAADHLRAAHGARPADTTIACNLIAVLIDNGNLEGALEIATPELARADATLRIARYRGFVAQSLERFDEAVTAYEHVVAREPQDFESWNNLGNARHETGDLDAAMDAFQRARQLDPNKAIVFTNLARVLMSKDRYEDACLMLEKAALLSPGDPAPLIELGRTLTSMDHPEAGLRALGDAARRATTSAVS